MLSLSHAPFLETLASPEDKSTAPGGCRCDVASQVMMGLMHLDLNSFSLKGGFPEKGFARPCGAVLFARQH